MKTNHDIFEKIEEIFPHAVKIEITKGSNGYPKHLGEIGVINFDTYEEAKAMAETYGASICLFYRKNGWQLWENRGVKYEPLTVENYISDLGDDYNEAIIDNDYIKEILNGLVDNSDFNGIEKFLNAILTIKDEMDAADENETVIVHNHHYFDTVSNKMMGYCEDTHHWAIGLLLPEIAEEDDEGKE